MEFHDPAQAQPEAIRQAETAIRLWIKTAKEDGLEIRQPRGRLVRHSAFFTLTSAFSQPPPGRMFYETSFNAARLMVPERTRYKTRASSLSP